MKLFSVFDSVSELASERKKKTNSRQNFQNQIERQATDCSDSKLTNMSYVDYYHTTFISAFLANSFYGNNLDNMLGIYSV